MNIFEYPTLDSQLDLMQSYLDELDSPIILDIVDATATHQQAMYNADIAHATAMLQAYKDLHMVVQAKYEETNETQHLKNMNTIINHIADIEAFIYG